MSPLRAFASTPIIKLGDNHFAKVSDNQLFNLIVFIAYIPTFPTIKVSEFLRRFAATPDLLDLDHLTVSGDVTFGKGVSLKVYNRCTMFLEYETHSLRCFTRER